MLPQRRIDMAVAKVSEITAESTESFEDAIRQGIDRASKTLHGIRGRLGQGTESDRRERQDHQFPGSHEGDLRT
jgi:hypothetical protein